MTFLEYCRMVKSEAERMNATYSSIVFTDCKQLEGWTIQLSVTAPNHVESDDEPLR